MPQLIKGGKYVFGWSVIQNDGRIRIPDEAYDEYHFSGCKTVILLSGSKTSGGFSIHKPDVLAETKPGSRITKLIGYNEESGLFTSSEPEVLKSGIRLIGWTTLDHEKCIKFMNEWFELLALQPGNRLLVGRGSGLGPAFIARGTIYREAMKHNDLLVF